MRPLVLGFIEKFSELSADRQRALSDAESGELILASRGGQLTGALVSYNVSKRTTRRALAGLRATGAGAAKKRAKGAALAIKALGAMAGSTVGAGLTSRKIMSSIQNYRRGRLRGDPPVPVKYRIKQVQRQIGAELRQVEKIPRSYISIHNASQ